MLDAVYAFLRAALPWIAMGLALAIFFAKAAEKEKTRKE